MFILELAIFDILGIFQLANNDHKMNQRTNKEETPSTFNAFLKTLFKCGLAAFALFLILAPFLPSLVLSYANYQDQVIYVNEENFERLGAIKNQFKNIQPIPKENTLFIPKIGVNGQIYEGKGEDTLNLGIWRRPKTSTPDKGGNTVLAAHRFLYTSGPITFYHLDKLVVGDKITIFWNKQRYEYEVIETKEVLPTAIEIENNTKEPILTLFTCTPLFSTERRLVVVAKLVDAPAPETSPQKEASV